MTTPGEGTGGVLSQYDDTDVNYLSYWTARRYEHRAEVPATLHDDGSSMSGRPTILFACRTNVGRSVTAKVLAEHYAASAVEVFSAGSEPGDAVHPEVASVLADLGVDRTQAPHGVRSERPLRHRRDDGLRRYLPGLPRRPIRTGRSTTRKARTNLRCGGSSPTPTGPGAPAPRQPRPRPPAAHVSARRRQHAFAFLSSAARFAECRAREAHGGAQIPGRRAVASALWRRSTRSPARCWKTPLREAQSGHSPRRCPPSAGLRAPSWTGC